MAENIIGKQWAVFFGIVLSFLWAGSGVDEAIAVDIRFAILGVILTVGYAYWIYYAVSHRKLFQLTVLLITQIIPMLNPVGAVIMLEVLRVSSKEVKGEKME